MFGRLTNPGFTGASAPEIRFASRFRLHDYIRLKSIGIFLAILLLAVIVGDAIARESWVYILAMVGLIIALLWPIEAALTAYVFLVPFEAVSILGSGKSGTTLNWAVGGLAGVGLLVAGIVKKRFAFPTRAVQLWLIFLLWSIVTTEWAASPEAARKQIPTAIALILLYALAASWRATERQLSVLCYCTVLGGFLASIAVIYLYSSGVTYATWTQTSRASLIVADRQTNPDRIAAELLLPCSLAIAWFVSTRNWRGRLAALGIFGIMGYAALLTMSRAFIVALGVMLCVYIWRLGLNRRILVLGSILCVLLFVMPSTFFLRLKDASGAGRLDIWLAGLTPLKTYWLAGAGFANFPVVYNAYAGSAPTFEGFNRGSHNIYLNVAVELGVVGIVLMIAALWHQLRGMAKLHSSLAGASSLLAISFEAACWAVLANGFFGDIMWSKPFWVPWILLAMVLRCDRQSPQQRVEQPISDEEVLSSYPFIARDTYVN